MILLCHFEKFGRKFGGVVFFFSVYPPWIRIRMDIFWILDPDPHKNVCGSETLFCSVHLIPNYFP